MFTETEAEKRVRIFKICKSLCKLNPKRYELVLIGSKKNQFNLKELVFKGYPSFMDMHSYYEMLGNRRITRSLVLR